MDLLTLVFYFLIIIPSSIIHEFAHGWVADKLGDPTARYAGRLTLNPLAHIDPIGTLLLPLALFMGSGGRFMFAYAKPVPYNPYNLRNQKWGPALVGFAGPTANFLLAFSFACVLRAFPDIDSAQLIHTVIYANVLLMVFNLVPIPPLDGSKILFALFPDSWLNVRMLLERWGYILLFIFVFFLFDVIQPLIQLVYGLLVGSTFF